MEPNRKTVYDLEENRWLTETNESPVEDHSTSRRNKVFVTGATVLFGLLALMTLSQKASYKRVETNRSLEELLDLELELELQGGPSNLRPIDSSDEQKVQPLDSSDEQKVYDAVIIGAGWSGLSAAAELISKGIDNILILEARDYIGGRSRTARNFTDEDPDMPFELGSEYIYTEWDNLILDIFDDEHVSYETLDWTTGVFNPALATKDTDSSLMDDSSYKKYESLWDNRFVEHVQRFESDRSASYETVLKDFEKEEDLTDSEDQIMDTFLNSNIVIEYAGDVDTVATHGTSSWVSTDCNGFMALTGVDGGGYDLAVDRFVKKSGLDVDNQVILGADVKNIRYGENNLDMDLVEIDYIHDETEKSVVAKTVLVTVPLGVLKSCAIEFEPELPSYKRDAIDDMQVGLLDKIHMYWDEEAMERAPNFEANWEEAGDKFAFLLDTPANNSSITWTDFQNVRQQTGTRTMTGLIGGSAAEAMEAMTDKEILDEVVNSLKLMFGSDVVPPTKYILTRWGSDPYSMGSYTHKSPDVDFDDAAQKLARSVEDKVFFAGEHTSYPYWSGTTVGAIETGQIAAKDMSEIISSFSDGEDLVITEDIVFVSSSSGEKDLVSITHDKIAVARTLP